MAPRFKAGNYGDGIARGVDDIITVLTTDASEWKQRPSLRVDGRAGSGSRPTGWLIGRDHHLHRALRGAWLRLSAGLFLEHADQHRGQNSFGGGAEADSPVGEGLRAEDFRAAAHRAAAEHRGAGDERVAKKIAIAYRPPSVLVEARTSGEIVCVLARTIFVADAPGAA